MAQILRPDEQISVSNVNNGSGGTTNLHNQINDESDTTYIRGTSIFFFGSLTVGLPEPPNVPPSGDSTVYFRIKGIGNITCEIFQTTTSKGSLTKTSTDSWTTWSFTATLTDYSDLRVTISGLKIEDYVSEVWVEVPGASGGLEMGCNF